MPYRYNVHRIVTDLMQPWLIGYRRPTVLAGLLAVRRHRHGAAAEGVMAMTLPEPQIARYQRWLRDTRGLAFDSYDALWRWSCSDLDAFWRSIWD